MYEIRYKAKTCQAYLKIGSQYRMLDAGYWMLDAGFKMSSRPGTGSRFGRGIFAVVGKIMVLDVAILRLDIGCWRSIPP
jgi:hypothetical protein